MKIVNRRHKAVTEVNRLRFRVCLLISYDDTLWLIITRKVNSKKSVPVIV